MEPTIQKRERLSARSQRIHESITLAIAAQARQMRSQGIDVASLSTGEPDFPTPDVIKEGAIQAIRDNVTKYDHAAGMLELRTVIARKLVGENNVPATPGQIVVSNGGKQALQNTLLAILDDGDQVLLPSPYWSSYPDIIRLADGQPVILPTRVEDRYKISPEQLRQAITPQTRAVLLNSPSNPSGVMYTRQELEAIGRVCAANNLYVLSDELYEKIVYDGKVHFSIGSMPELRDLAITVNGVSKSYSMTGWRIGYLCAPPDVANAAYCIQSQMTSHPSTISQRAAITALTQASAESAAMVQAFALRRDVIMKELSVIQNISYPEPDGAFYVFLDVSRYVGTQEMPDSMALSEYLLRTHHVAVIPGTAFGAPQAIRLSYACSEDEIRRGVQRLHKGLQALEQ